MEHVKHFKEASSHSLPILLWVLFIALAQLFDPIVSSKLNLLSCVHSFFLAHWPVKVNMLLLQLGH